MTEKSSPTKSSDRQSPRVAVEAFVKVSGADREFVLRTRDLSEAGFFLFTKVAHIYPFRVGSRLNLELYDYDRAVRCEVVVVRVVEAGSAEADDYPTGFGLKITSMDAEDRSALRAMLQRIQEAGGLY